MSSRGMDSKGIRVSLSELRGVGTGQIIPETDCPECQWAELTKWQRVRQILFPPETAYQRYLNGQMNAFRIFTRPPEKTWYEKHRENYAIGGKEIELQRMLRHVR